MDILNFNPKSVTLPIKHEVLDETRNIVFRNLSFREYQHIMKTISSVDIKENVLMDTISNSITKLVNTQDDADWLLGNFDPSFIGEVLRVAMDKLNSVATRKDTAKK